MGILDGVSLKWNDDSNDISVSDDGGGGGGGGGGSSLDGLDSKLASVADATPTVEEDTRSDFRKKLDSVVMATPEAAPPDPSGGATASLLKEKAEDNDRTGTSGGSTPRKKGGTLDKALSAVEGAADSAAGALDHAAGSTDESVARSTDKEEGGGAFGGTADFLATTSGLNSYARSQDFAQKQQMLADAKAEGGLKGAFMGFDTAVKTGVDFVADNPNASAQDTTRGGLKTVAELATGEENVTDEELAQGAASAAGDVQDMFNTATEGTVVDNPVTKGVGWVGEALIADPAKAVTTAATGVDIDEGTSEGTVGAVDLADVAASATGVGAAGKAGVKAATASDEGATLASRLASRFTDDGGEAATKATDDLTGTASSSADESTEIGTDLFGRVTTDGSTAGPGGLFDGMAGVADDATAGARRTISDLLGRGTDDAATVTDDAATTVDDAVQTADGATDDAVREAVESTEDSGGLLSRITDDAATGSDDVAETAARSTDEVAQTADGATDDAVREAVEEVEEGDGLLSRFGRGSDDVAEAGVKTSDDVAAAGDDAAEAGTKAADDLADEGGDVFNLGTWGKIGLGGIGLIGGGALLDALGTFDTLEITDPQTGEVSVLHNIKDYEPTEKHPNGGRLWEVRTKPKDGGKGTSQGYTVILGVSGRNVTILGGNGEPTKAQVPVETMREAMQRARSGSTGGSAGGSA